MPKPTFSRERADYADDGEFLPLWINSSFSDPRENPAGSVPPLREHVNKMQNRGRRKGAFQSAEPQFVTLAFPRDPLF
ncbi:hypothetical protein J6590_060237 [Homalodisca vitripennis]|nr:hypothetical protein J6590_060237 [Homalodisca vitripennis]